MCLCTPPVGFLGLLEVRGRGLVVAAFLLDGPKNHVRSGGPCPPHRDYEPVGPYHKERSVSFYMLLHDTAEHHGGTFVYPGSRDLQSFCVIYNVKVMLHRRCRNHIICVRWKRSKEMIDYFCFSFY